MGMGEGQTVLGVNVAAGVAYLALVAASRSPKLDDTAKIEPAANLDEWQQLAQFGQRLVTESRRVHAACVAFAEPRLFKGWKYYEAYSRVSLQVAGSLALTAAGIRVRGIAQKTAAATLGFRKLKEELDKQLAAKLRINAKDVNHWKHRVPALAVALHVASELWP